MPKLLYLEQPELAALLAAAKQNGADEHALLSTIYVMALRASEAASLRVADFDYDRRRLIVGVLKRRHRKLQPDGTKPENVAPPPRVACEVPPQLATILKAQARRNRGAEWLFPPIVGTGKASPTRFHVATVYNRAARRVGLDAPRVRHVHLLRHSRAMHHLAYMKAQAAHKKRILTALEMMGELKALLRHASEQTCLQYIHATEETTAISEEATASLVGDLLGA